MRWIQNYDPLNFWPLSTLIAALPVLTLFFVLLVLKKKVWLSALCGFIVAVVLAASVLRMPAADDLQCSDAWIRFRIFPDCLDYHRFHFPLQHFAGNRAVRGYEAIDCLPFTGCASADGFDRILFRGVS